MPWSNSCNNAGTRYHLVFAVQLHTLIVPLHVTVCNSEVCTYQLCFQPHVTCSVLHVILHASHNCEPFWQVLHLVNYVNACHGTAQNVGRPCRTQPFAQILT